MKCLAQGQRNILHTIKLFRLENICEISETRNHTLIISSKLCILTKAVFLVSFEEMLLYLIKTLKMEIRHYMINQEHVNSDQPA